MRISPEQVKELREKTGAGIMDCKRALEECQGDLERSIEYLRQQGIAVATKRQAKSAAEGTIAAYIHAGGKIGVLVEVNCETDFVAKTDEFQAFAKDLAMQVAASQPDHICREDVPPEIMEKEREIYRAAAIKEGKPEKVLDRIAEGKLEKFFSTVCLLEQPFIRDPDRTIQDLLNEVSGKLGEKVVIRRFVRYQVGQ